MRLYELKAWTALFALVVAGCADKTSEAHRMSRFAMEQRPTVLKGNTIAGIEAEFMISGYDPSTAHLTGAISLTNTTDAIKHFRYFDAFALHLSLRDHDGHPVPFVDGVHMINPIVRSVNVTPGNIENIAFDISLVDVFSLKRGDYQVLFVYDVRLLRPPDPAIQSAEPIVPWSSEPLRIDYR